MTHTASRIVYWTPRILCILFGLFVSIFAFDVFEEHHGVWEIAVALFMHLIPTWVIFLTLWASWRREWIGGLVYTLLVGLDIWWAWGRFTADRYLLIDVPVLIVAALLWWNWMIRREATMRSAA